MFRTVTAFAVAVFFAAGPAVAVEEVDVELCLAADGSGSITDAEFAFQRSSYAAALSDPRVIDEIAAGLIGRIAVAHLEWGGPESIETIVDWTPIADVADARGFGAALVSAPRKATGWNSISNAILTCVAWIEGNGYRGLRKVIDVSGDAGQRGGAPLEAARQTALDAGVVINALALDFRGGGLTGPGGMPLLAHFNRDVIAGPGSFSLAVTSPEAFVESLVRKLVLEIAGRSGPGPGTASR